MEVLCDHIDGTLTFIGNFILQTLEYSIRGNDLSIIGQSLHDFADLAVLRERYFFSKVKQEIKVETCFLILSVLSYLIIRRNDL